MRLEKEELLVSQETKVQPAQPDPTEHQEPQERTEESDVPDKLEESDFLESEGQLVLVEMTELTELWDLMDLKESKDWPVLSEEKDELDEEAKPVSMVPEAQLELLEPQDHVARPVDQESMELKDQKD